MARSAETNFGASVATFAPSESSTPRFAPRRASASAASSCPASHATSSGVCPTALTASTSHLTGDPSGDKTLPSVSDDDHLRASLRRRAMQRRGPGPVGHVRLAPGGDELADDVHAALARGVMDGSLAAGVGRVGVGARGEERGYHAGVAAARRGV